MKVICINNDDYPCDLSKGKCYDVISEMEGMYRLIDDSEEAYYFEKGLFKAVRIISKIDLQGVSITSNGVGINGYMEIT